MFISGVDDQDGLGPGLAQVLPAMRKMSFEKQAISWLQQIGLSVDGVGDTAFQAIDEFIACVDNILLPADCVRFQGHYERFNFQDGRACAQVFQDAPVKGCARPAVCFDVGDVSSWLVSFEEGRYWHVEGERQLLKCADARGTLSVLDQAQSVDGQAALFGQTAHR